MEFNMKSIRGLAAEAATVFSRAVQYTEEKFGTSEKTELDAHFDGLALRSDRTKHWTEKIVSRTDAVLQPNPNTRVEDYLFEKLDKRRERQSNFDLLGQDMIDAGADIGSSTPYGSALIKVGRTQQRLGTAERDFIRASMSTFVGPLKRFLDGDMKTIMKERKILENKRLDLDACKNRLRKARSMEGQANAETELRISQAEFDRQAEITRLLLEGISSAHANHLRCLNDFVEAQAAYYAQCQQFMIDLQKELSSSTTVATGNVGGSFQDLYPPSPGSPSAPSIETSLPADKKRARVLYNYEAYDNNELSLTADEVIIVSSPSGMDPDWMLGERGTAKGKVPLAYLEILN